MATLTFDTLKFSKKLESGGVPREQATVIAEAVADVQTENLDQLATKTDLARVEERLRSEITQLEQRMIIKLGTMLFVLAGALIAAMKVIGH